VIVVAFILVASVFSSSGETVRSLAAITNQVGLFFHAGIDASPANAGGGSLGRDQAQDVASSAHNAQETPLFAKCIEKRALAKRAVAK